MWLRLERRKPPFHPVCCRALITSQGCCSLAPRPCFPGHGGLCPPFPAESLHAVHPRDSLVVSPGKVFATVMEVQDFIVSECGQCLPMWATTSLLEWLWLQPSLCKLG